jgi:hypothetical protein
VADILLAVDNGNDSEAEAWVEADDKNGRVFLLGKDYALCADMFRRRGDTVKARENLTRAIEVLEACRADGWVKLLKEALARL